MRWAGVVLAGLVVVGCSSDDVAPSTAPYTADEPAPTIAPTPTSEVTEGAELVAVVDGDTLEVRVGGRVERLRLVGINSPEDGECLSDEAAARLRELVGGQELRLVRDVSDRDQYDRLLRHVLVGGRSVGEQLVADGLALSRAYPPDTTLQGPLDAAQRQAEAVERGMWAPDACGPASRASVRVGAANPDPPGDESQTPNEEWIEVDNTGSRPVDLTGWGVRDESASHRFEFPDGFRLAPGASVRIHTGCGSDTGTDLFWCISGSAVWNNDGDTAFLTDPAGNIADQRAL